MKSFTQEIKQANINASQSILTDFDTELSAAIDRTNCMTRAEFECALKSMQSEVRGTIQNVDWGGNDRKQETKTEIL